MIPLLQEDGSLFVRCFGERGERTLYDDDGVSWNFERGECAVLRMSFSRTDGRVQGRWSVESHGWASAYTHVEFA